jgi:hypothetical protein
MFFPVVKNTKQKSDIFLHEKAVIFLQSLPKFVDKIFLNRISQFPKINVLYFN